MNAIMDSNASSRQGRHRGLDPRNFATLPRSFPTQPLLIVLSQCICGSIPLLPSFIDEAQFRVSNCVADAAEGGVAFVVHCAVSQRLCTGGGEVWIAQEAPNLREVPVYHGVDAHEGWPVAVCGVEVGEGAAVGVCAAGADKDGADGGAGLQV